MALWRVFFLSAVAAAVLLGAIVFALPVLRSSPPRGQARLSPPVAGTVEPMPAGKVDTGTAPLPVLADRMPPFAGIVEWLNGGPESPESLKGRVVLVHFWTFGCINCVHTMPYVTAWHDRYAAQGFTVIGVHTPEFSYEGEKKAVLAAIALHGVHYPVPMDNGYKTWNLYGNRYWPSFYLFDAEGRLRYRSVGEGGYDAMETNIKALLAEARRP